MSIISKKYSRVRRVNDICVVIAQIFAPFNVLSIFCKYK